MYVCNFILSLMPKKTCPQSSMMAHRPELLLSILDWQDHHATTTGTFFSAKSRWFYLNKRLHAALKTLTRDKIWSKCTSVNLTTSSRRSPGDHLLDGNYDSSLILNPSLSTLFPLSRDTVYHCDSYI